MNNTINGFEIFIKNGNNLFAAEYYFEGNPEDENDAGIIVITGKEKKNKDDEDVNEEIKFLKNNVSSAAEIASMYNKTNTKKRGYSTIMIAEMLDVSTKSGSRYRSEKAISIDIFDKLQTL